MSLEPQPQPAAPARRRGVFAPRMSSSVPGNIEAALALFVIAGIFVVAFLVFQIPGPLVVRMLDDKGAAVMGARVKCTGPEGGGFFTGITDVFGETKWPGLKKGPWRCEAVPPDLFHGDLLFGGAVVGERTPALVPLRVERPAYLSVEVTRPKGGVRAAVAVRAVCEAAGGKPAVGWESRAGVLGGPAVLWLPHGRKCRAGLVHPELAANRAGLAPKLQLECEKLPCSGELEAGVGGVIEVLLEPTPEQWAEARPAPEP